MEREARKRHGETETVKERHRDRMRDQEKGGGKEQAHR